MTPTFRFFQSAFRDAVVALALLVWIFAAPVATAGDGSLVQAKKFPALFGGSFTLIDHEGRKRTDRDFSGRFVLIYFGYTYCPDICPTGLQTLSTALDLLGERAEKIQPLFVSVDPERDTPEMLKSYVVNFHPRLLGLTGSEQQVREAGPRVPGPSKQGCYARHAAGRISGQPHINHVFDVARRGIRHAVSARHGRRRHGEGASASPIECDPVLKVE